MFEMLTDYQIWVSLLTLTALEIVLGIDNLIFLSIVSGRLPKHQQQTARRIGLALALLGGALDRHDHLRFGSRADHLSRRRLRA